MFEQVETFFNDTYDKNYSSVIKFVVSKCRNITDVQDIVQDVFMELYNLLQNKGVSYIKNPEAFLIKIAKVKLYKYYTLADRIKDIISKRFEDDISYQDIVIEDNDIEERVLNRLTIESVWKIIKQKDPITQKVFYLFYYLDMTIREIAELLRLTESNVKHKIYRTLEDIRLKLKEGD